MTKEELEQKIREQEKTVEQAYNSWPYEWYLRETDKLSHLKQELQEKTQK